MGSSLNQIQNGKPKLIANARKRLPKAVRKYSITELEMCGLARNITSFVHLLKRVDSDAMVDDLALTQIIKSKAGLTTTKIMLCKAASVECYFNMSRVLLYSLLYTTVHLWVPFIPKTILIYNNNE